MPKNANPDSKQPTITEKLAALDTAVEWFYDDDFSLDQALDKYQSAARLAKEVEHDLAELKNQVEVLEDFTKS